VHTYSLPASTEDDLRETQVSEEFDFACKRGGLLYLLFGIFPTLFRASVVGAVVVLLPERSDRQLPLEPQHLLLRLPEKVLEFGSATLNREALRRHITIMSEIQHVFSFIKISIYKQNTKKIICVIISTIGFPADFFAL